MKACVIIPVYNHQHAIASVVDQIKIFGLHCYLINDGSSVDCSKVLQKIASEESEWVTLFERESNGGKGAAVIDGFKLASQDGFSHAIQVDADGQHQLDDISHFLDASEKTPDKLILGAPQFDESVPKKRLYGRQITNAWIWIHTLSFSIKDGMCGFRCYPLIEVNKLLASTTIAKGMDFDIDIIVKLYWQGVDVINVSTNVRYPIDGVSHFNMLQDNVLISIKHTQLFFGMLVRFPKLLLRHFS